MAANGLRSEPPDNGHELAVLIERALKSQDWWQEGQYAIEPPDSEEAPDNFGVSFRGELLYIVRVEPW